MAKTNKYSLQARGLYKINLNNYQNVLTSIITQKVLASDRKKTERGTKELSRDDFVIKPRGSKTENRDSDN